MKGNQPNKAAAHGLRYAPPVRPHDVTSNYMKKTIWLFIYGATLVLNWLHLLYTGDLIANYVGYSLSLWLVPLAIYLMVLILAYKLNFRT